MALQKFCFFGKMLHPVLHYSNVVPDIGSLNIYTNLTLIVTQKLQN